MQLCFDATRFGTGIDGAVELAQTHGFGAVEYSFAPFSASNKESMLAPKEKKFLKSIKALTDEKQVSIACLNLDFCLRPEEKGKKANKSFKVMLTKLAQAAQILGCPKVTVFIAPGSENGWLEHAQTSLAEIGPILKEFEVGLLLRLSTAPEFRGKSLQGWQSMQPQDWRDLLATCPGLGLSFSPADCVWLGIDYLAVLSGLVSAIEHIEAHDVEINRELLKDSGLYGPLWWRYRVPGKGQVDWTQLIEALKLYDFKGTFSIHLDDEFLADDLESLTTGLDAAAKLLKPLVAN